MTDSPAVHRELAHWRALKPGRDREYTGQTYDTSIVKRVFADEVHGWEHSHTTGALVDLATRDAWEAHGVPPIHLAYSEAGFPSRDGSRLHYAIVDGHHRLNAIRRVPGSGGQVGVPAMVTAKWTGGDDGVHSGYRGMPMTAPDASLPKTWNRSSQPLIVRVPEKVERSTVYGRPQIKLSLPGRDAMLSLADIAGKLNGVCRPDEFFKEGAGDKLAVRMSLSDVYGHSGKNDKLGTIHADFDVGHVDTSLQDWNDILKDKSPMRLKCTTNAGADYPIMELRIQQTRDCFLNDDW